MTWHTHHRVIQLISHFKPRKSNVNPVNSPPTTPSVPNSRVSTVDERQMFDIFGVDLTSALKTPVISIQGFLLMVKRTHSRQDHAVDLLNNLADNSFERVEQREIIDDHNSDEDHEGDEMIPAFANNSATRPGKYGPPIIENTKGPSHRFTQPQANANSSGHANVSSSSTTVSIPVSSAAASVRTTASNAVFSQGADTQYLTRQTASCVRCKRERSLRTLPSHLSLLSATWKIPTVVKRNSRPTEGTSRGRLCPRETTMKAPAPTVPQTPHDVGEDVGKVAFPDDNEETIYEVSPGLSYTVAPYLPW